MVTVFEQGDIVYLDFDPQSGHEQRGRRERRDGNTMRFAMHVFLPPFKFTGIPDVLRGESSASPCVHTRLRVAARDVYHHRQIKAICQAESLNSATGGSKKRPSLHLKRRATSAPYTGMVLSSGLSMVESTLYFCAWRYLKNLGATCGNIAMDRTSSSCS